ncbi:hypothetical protein [Microbispora sp. NPDC046933]|uniref:NACHT domain-containing protein n=1 Tax=Microbispora sp. NPDC046933 TaxID=3155618 RepID=UPI0033E1E4C6
MRVAVVIVALVASLAVTGALAWVLSRDGVGEAADWAQLAGGWVLAIIVAMTPVVRWWRAAAAPVRGDAVAAQATLATAVLGQWLNEIAARGLEDPRPIDLRWSPTARPIADHLENVGLPISGSMGDISELVAQYRALARQRLVILGDVGSGKTSLAVLLVRELLRDRSPEEPVPVLLTMADWGSQGTVSEPFGDWLARRLGQDYPFLVETYGPDTPAALVRERRVLPVLDGLDELPAPTRPEKLRALNAAMSGSDSLILTCRTAEFEEAVLSPDGDVITGAAVIEPEPVEPGDAAWYLQARLRPGTQGGWPELLDDLRGERRTVLARTLTSPFTLWLLQATYIGTGANLADLNRLGTTAEVTDHLLERLVPALIATNRYGSAVPWPYRLEDVQRWLAFFARRLRAEETYDLAWWDLRGEERPIGRLTMPLCGLFLGVVLSLWLPLVLGLGIGLGIALVGLVVGPVTDDESDQRYYRSLRSAEAKAAAIGPIESLRANLAGEAVRGLRAGLVFGVAVGVVTGLFFGVREGVLLGVSGGVVNGVLTAVTGVGFPGAAFLVVFYGSFDLFTRSLPVGIAATAVLGLNALGSDLLGLPAGAAIMLFLCLTIARVLRRRRFLLEGLAIWALSWAWYPLVRLFDIDVSQAVLIAGAIPAALFLLPGIGAGLASAFMIIRPVAGYLLEISLLRIRFRIPARPMRFFAACHRLGILRQVGPVYQFRHAILQDYLARDSA